MEYQIRFSDLLYLLTAVTGIITGIILSTYRKPHLNRFNHYLGVAFILLSSGIFISFLIKTSLIERAPLLYRYGNLLALFFIPCSYLYIRSIVLLKSFDLSDLLFFLPALLYLVDFFPVLAMASDDKLALIHYQKSQGIHYLSFEEGWFTPPWFHLYFRHSIMLVFWVMQLNLLLRIERNHRYLLENKHWNYWIWSYQLHQILYILPLVIYLFFPLNTNIALFSELMVIGSLFILCIYLLFKPEILYGVVGIINLGKATNNELDRPKPDQKSSYFPKQQVQQVLAKLESLMDTEKPYLVPRYSINDLANNLEVAPWLLSAVLNKHLGTNFNEYINRFRIEHSIGLITNGEFQKMTIEGLAIESGFNNRNSYTKAFKAVKRTTPSQYIRQYLELSANN